MGAIIGTAVGLVFYFIQQQQKKKSEASNDTIDVVANSTKDAKTTEESTSK